MKQDQIYLNRYGQQQSSSFFNIFSCCRDYDVEGDQLSLPMHFMLNQPLKKSQLPSRREEQSRADVISKSALYTNQPLPSKTHMKRSLHQEIRPSSYKMPEKVPPVPHLSSYNYNINSTQASLNSTDPIRSSQDSSLRFSAMQQRPKFNFSYSTTPTPLPASAIPIQQSLIKPPSQSILHVAELSDQDADSVVNLNKLYGDKELLVSLEMQKKSSSASSKPRIKRLSSHPHFQAHNLMVRQAVSIKEPNTQDDEDRESVVITNSLLGSNSLIRTNNLLMPIYEVDKESRITQKMTMI